METTIGSYHFTGAMAVTSNPDMELKARRMVAAALDWLAAHPGEAPDYYHHPSTEFRGHVAPQNAAAREMEMTVLAAGGAPDNPPSGHAYQDALRLVEWIQANSFAAWAANPSVADAWRDPPPAL